MAGKSIPFITASFFLLLAVGTSTLSARSGGFMPLFFSFRDHHIVWLGESKRSSACARKKPKKWAAHAAQSV
jgi:hypothetical protein